MCRGKGGRESRKRGGRKGKWVEEREEGGVGRGKGGRRSRRGEGGRGSRQRKGENEKV